MSWFDEETIEPISTPYEPIEAAPSVGEFESECPCCGAVMTFKLYASAVTDEPETDR